jgi:hypothetical protein
LRNSKNRKSIIILNRKVEAEPEKSCRGGSAPVAAKVQNYTTHEKKILEKNALNAFS